MRPRASFKRLVTWALALAALTLVCYVVPLRDRCVDPGSPKAPRVAMVAAPSGCTLLRQSGPAHLDATTCAALQCERGLVSILRGSNVGLLAALFGVYLGVSFIWAARWRRLLHLARLNPTLTWTWRVTMQAQAAGILLPGGLGGDALRAASVVGTGASIPIAVGSLLLDRAVGLSTLAALGAAAGATVTGTSNDVVVAMLGCIPVGFVLGLIVLRSRVVRASPLLRAGFFARTVRPIVEYLSAPGAPRAVIGSALLSVLVSAATLGINRGIIAAIGAHPTSEKWVYVGLTLVFCTSVLPTLPGGWGTSDAATIYFLGLAGLPASSALAVCLLYRLFWYLSAAIGALLLLVRPVAPAAAPTVDPSLQAADPPP